jgi:hypothetical protein
MPRRKKRAHEMTGDELIHKLFPKRVVKHLKKVANPPETKSPKKPMSRD